MHQAHDTQTIQIDDGEWITATELAKCLRMTEAWVYAQTRAHLIPHVKLGRYVRYRPEAIAAWLAGIERGTPTLTVGAERQAPALTTLGRRP